MLIGASLGAFYVLQYEDIIDKLVINPCMYPSIEIPNSILINGHHSIEEEYLTGGLQQAEKYF